MSVMMQAFYWDAPQQEKQEGNWWNFVAEHVEALGKSGFNALWLPPVSKASDHRSMGYDPYDYFDLGDYDQKGGTKTLYGNRAELEALIAKAHANNLGLYADMVINHNSGADEEEVNPLDGQKRWTKFNPKSGKFPRDWNSFHPSRFEQVMASASISPRGSAHGLSVFSPSTVTSRTATNLLPSSSPNSGQAPKKSARGSTGPTG